MDTKKVWKIVDKVIDKTVQRAFKIPVPRKKEVKPRNTHYELLSVKNKIKYMNGEKF